MAQIIEQLIDILYDKDKNHNYLYINDIGNGFEIEYGAMYESPNLGLDKLIKLSELFGTTNIDVDDYSISGCETCDWGSDYGHTIQVKEPTRNVDEIKEALKNQTKYKL